MSELMNQQANILIISPDVKLSKEIGKALSHVSQQMMAVPASRDALKKVRDGRFDLVITDSRLTDLSCPVLIRRIMARDPRPDILVGLPIESWHRQQELLDCGADDVFEIPLKAKEFHLKVKKVLKEKSFLESCGLVGK
ncbi:MAG: hypothetical protein JSV10_04905, partial [Candidatus Zixiibacteriota bacterium]